MQRDHSATALLQIGNSNPGFKRLFRDRLGERFCPGERSLAVQHQPSRFAFSAADQGDVHLANMIPQVFIEIPGSKGQGPRAGFRGCIKPSGSGFAGSAFKCVQFGAERFNVRSGLCNLCGSFLGKLDIPFAELHACQRGCHAVVVLGRNRVELVIVTSRTIRCHAEKCLADHSDQVFHFVLTHGFAHRVVGRLGRIVWTCDQTPHGNRSASIWCQNVTGDLVPDKFVIWHIRVQGIDHPVAIRPGIIAGLIIFKAVAFPKMHHVQPMPSPAFPVVR